MTENKKKSLINAALELEISYNVEEVLDVLVALKFIKKPTFFVDSAATCWLEDEPSEKDKKAVLKKLGYDV